MTDKKPKNPMAFPRAMTATGPGDGHNIQDYGDFGMSLRDYFACAALQSYVRLEPNKHALNAVMAYAQADAMLEARVRE